MGEGSRRQLTYITESVWGTTPDTPAMKVLRANGGSGIRLGRQALQSQEMRSDRQVADLRLGNKNPTLEVPFEFSYESFDAFLEAALFGTFAVAYALTGLTVDVVASAKTFTRSTGSFITDGVKVGDKITFSGFTAAGNNGTFVVSAVEALMVTCATATGLVDVTDDTDVTATTDRKVLKQDVTKKSFTIEEGFLDLATPQFQVMTGAMVNAMSLDIKPNAMITGSFSLVGKSAGAFSAVSLDASPDAAPTYSPFDSYTGALKEGGSALAIVTGIAAAIANGVEALYALFSADAHRLGVGRANLTGTLTAFFEDAVLANKFLNETESSLEWTLEDLAGNAYRFTVPRIKYTGSDKALTENNVTITCPFQALYDAATGTTIIVEKIPA